MKNTISLLSTILLIACNKNPYEEKLKSAWIVKDVNIDRGNHEIHEGTPISFTDDYGFHPSHGKWTISNDTLNILSSIPIISGTYKVSFKPENVAKPPLLILENTNPQKASFKLTRFEVNLEDYLP